MYEEELMKYNPWWEDDGAIGRDSEVQAWYDSKLKWDARASQTFSEEDYIYSLRGPRQVGKTTLVKLNIEQALRKVPKWNVMYYSFEVENSPGDVVDVVNGYFDYVEHDAGSRHFIYLDEISGIRNWQKGIKRLKDQGRLRNSTVLTTGSHATDLRLAVELLPGRRGLPRNETLDRVLLPMKFREFVSAVDPQMVAKIPGKYLSPAGGRGPRLVELAAGIADKELAGLWIFKGRLDRYLDYYLLTGGMPAAVNEFLHNRRIGESAYQVYLNSLMGGIARAGKNTAYATGLAFNIIKAMTNPVSWNSLRRDSDVASHSTVREYVQVLSDMFVLYPVYRYDFAEGRARPDSSKKVYFQDPFFMHALNGHTAGRDPYEMSRELLGDSDGRGRIVEQAVADHCRRLAFDIAPSKVNFSPESSVLYWRGKRREVDFVVRNGDSWIPVEAKYKGEVKRGDLYGLYDLRRETGTGGGIVVTRDRLGAEGEVAMIPASMFLFLV